MHKEFDDKLRAIYGPHLVGCDEARRGSWALSIVGAAVCLPGDFILPGLTDSKALSEKTRNEFSEIIKENALAYSVVEINAEAIDKRGITWANIEVMKQSCLEVKRKLNNVDFYVFDQSPSTGLQPSIIFPKADSISMSVAAASVLAKVYGDNLAREFHEKHPEYGFDKHKGYVNKMHIENVKKYGIIDGIYRKTFKIKGYNKS